MAGDNDFLVFLNPNSEFSNTPTDSPAVKPQARNYETEFNELLTASQFLTTIQKIALYTEDLAEYDTSDIAEMIHYFRRSELSSEAEQKLIDRLAAFRAKIEATDEHVHTANVRRLFTVGTPDQTSLERVICYYLSKANKTVADRDKIDLLVTRWGAFRIPGTERMVVLRSENNLIEKLKTVFQNLRLEMAANMNEKEVLEWLDNYRESLLNVRKMSEIVDKNYKAKLRDYKLSLGQFYYRPAVMSAIVEVNVALHNVLQEFYLSERARLELYVDHVKRKTGELAEPTNNPLFTLMSRAEEMRLILDETQAAIASQQVVDHSAHPPAETANNHADSRVDKLVALLEQTLQRTNELSQQIQSEITKKAEQIDK